MSEYSSFDILGPIMIGPSSSHTAGACRIANMARKICGEDFDAVEFQLHGSFAHTYKGHGTDKALIGGIMGFSPDDERLKIAKELANTSGLNYTISTVNLGDNYHPNTVRINLNYSNKENEYIIGYSIGGGSIIIGNINGMEVCYQGRHPTILLRYYEQRGVIAFISNILTSKNYNIESISTNKDEINNIVTLSVELDRELDNTVWMIIDSADMFFMKKYIGYIK